MLDNPLKCGICLIYNMTVPSIPGDHTAGFIDCPAESVDPMMAFLLRQYCLLEPVMEVAGYHLYQKVQLITFIVHLAVFAECKAGLDFINGCFYGAPLIIVVEDLG